MKTIFKGTDYSPHNLIFKILFGFIIFQTRLNRIGSKRWRGRYFKKIDTPVLDGMEEEKLFEECDECDYVSTSKLNLKHHVEAEHNNKEFSCKKCDYVGTSRGNLKLHNKNKHKENKYTCDACDFSCSDLFKFKKHRRRKHSLQEQNFKDKGIFFSNQKILRVFDIVNILLV